MFAKNITLFSGFLVFAAFANAHFQLQFPTPRGPFVEDSEPTFCDGYNNAVSNRSTFPLGQGFITLNSEHPDWSAQVLISIDQNPTNFSLFNTSSSGTQLPSAVPFFKSSGEGAACIAIDIANLGISNVKNGSNVTIQVQYDGGDGNLFQCADLTLSSDFTIPSNVNCSNLVSNSTTSSASGTATSAGSTSTSAALQLVVGKNTLLGMILATAFSFLWCSYST